MHQAIQAGWEPASERVSPEADEGGSGTAIAGHEDSPAATIVKYGCRVAAAAVMAATIAGGAAHATENGLFAGPLGGADIRSAYLPLFPGFYMAGIGIGGNYNGLVGNDGNKIPLRAHYFARLFGVAGLYEYPWRPFGGKIATTVYQGYFLSDEQIAPRAQSNGGLNDTYSDLLIWSKYLGPFGAEVPPSPPGAPKLPYGLTVSAAYSMVFPTGAYDVHNLANAGHNYYVFIPNFAISYLTGPNLSIGRGTEISTRFYYDVPTRNNANNYQSGQVFDVDWAVSQRFKGFQLGIAGNYARQTTGDSLNGVETGTGHDGNFLERATVGPVAEIDIPSIHAMLKGKVLWDVMDRNTFGDRIAATLTLSFRVF
jgi:hypothetical protein